MIMITNSFYLLPHPILHLHRILQYFVVTVLVVSYLNHHSTQHLILTIFIVLNIYQSLVLLLNLKNVAPNLKTTLMIVFIDGIITGLLIQFIGLYHALSIGIAGLFLLVYVKAFSAMTFSAIFGVTIAIITGHITAFPSSDIKTFTEILLLILMGSFLLSFCIIKGYEDKTLNEKLAQESQKINALKSHVNSLSKYLSPRLCQSIIAKENTDVDSRDRPITIFFSDMQGFSQLSEQLTPDKLSWLVNTYISEMPEIAFRFGGTLDKIIGDSIMVFFGDPISRGKKMMPYPVYAWQLQ
ncbi:MAG: adenylate/guanylate cyclase domain-containing protein [Porticoccaceae bacterium]